MFAPWKTVKTVDYRDPLTEHDLNNGRTAWWLSLPNQAGGPVWWDLVRGFQATLSGFSGLSGWSPVSKGPGTSLRFNGTTSFATLPFNSFPGGLGGYTAIGWFISTSTTGPPTLLSRSSSAFDGSGFSLYMNSTAVEDSTFATFQTTAATVSTGAIHQVAGVWSKALLSFYLDGVFKTSIATGATLLNWNGTAGTAYMGAAGNGAGARTGFLPGWLFSLELYAGRALSAAAIAENYQLFQQGLPGVLRHRRRAAWFLVPAAAPPAGGLKPIAAYARRPVVIGSGVH